MTAAAGTTMLATGGAYSAKFAAACCPEVPGANGQGRSKDEARENLADAIALILQDRREDGLRGVPPDAIHETVSVT